MFITFIKDNKDLIQEKGFYVWLEAWSKIILYLVVPLLILSLFVYIKWYIPAVLWLIPTGFIYGVLFGGQRFVFWISNKALAIRGWLYKK